MKLISIEQELPVFSPEARTIKEFSAIIRRDRGTEGDADGRKKHRALAELGFIYFYCSFDSRFDLYDTEELRIEAIKAMVGLPEDWKVDSIIRQALARYNDMMQTESMKLVQKSRTAIEKLENFIDSYDPLKVSNAGTLVFGPDKMQKLIDGIPNMIRSLNESKKIVEKELEDKYGGGKVKQRSLIESNAAFKNITDGEY